MPFWLLLAGAFAGIIYWSSRPTNHETGSRREGTSARFKRGAASSARWGALSFVALMVLRMGPWRAWALLSSAMAAWPALARLLQWKSRPEGQTDEKPRTHDSRTHAAPLSRSEAAALLDIEENAAREDIEAAYRKLMQRVHPDAGGNAYMAQLVNEARDTLLR